MSFVSTEHMLTVIRRVLVGWRWIKFGGDGSGRWWSCLVRSRGMQDSSAAAAKDADVYAQTGW